MKRLEKNKLTKDKILKAAIEEFGKNDYSVASTNEMCKNNNISKGLLFHHFKNKDDIFLQCVELAFNCLIDYIKSNYEKSPHGIEASLNHYFDIRRNFFSEYPEYNLIFKSATFNTPENLKEEISVLKEPLKELNREILSDLLKEESLNEEFTEKQVIDLILNFFEYLLIAQPHIEEIEVEQQMLKLIKMLMFGVLKKGED